MNITVVKAALRAPLLVLSLFMATSSFAACPTNPYTLTNGQTADASQVMANFNNLLACVNNLTPPTVNSFRNLFIGGDFTSNPWQRGTSFSAIAANTVVYTADRWFAYGGTGSAMSVNQQASGGPTGFPTTLQVQRPAANTNTTLHSINQVVESVNVRPYQGQTVTLSFYASAGANFSAASNNLSILAKTGTGVDEGSAAFAAGTWTGIATPLSTTQPITATMTRYSFTFALASNATELGVQIGFLPTGTAGSNDDFNIAAVQIEAGNTASSFEALPRDVVLQRCLRYYSTVTYANTAFFGYIVSGGYYYANYVLPVPMRSTPTISGIDSGDGVSGFAVTAGAFMARSPSAVTEARQATSTVSQGYFGSTVTASAEL
jgi:hypothetical protein